MLPELPPQSSPILAPGPPVAYLQQITHFSDGFSALLQGLWYENQEIEIVRGIANITIIAANCDPALEVKPIELWEVAVPGFLESLSWVLPRISLLQDGEDLNHWYIIAASVLIVAYEDQGSREKIVDHSGWMELRRELRDNKDVYLAIISEEERKRLVNGLAFGEADEEDEGNNDTSKTIANNNGTSANDGASMRIEELDEDGAPNEAEEMLADTKSENRTEGGGMNGPESE